VQKPLGRLATRFFAYMQMRGSTLARASELAAPLKLSRGQALRLLRRLEALGMIARVRPGLYLIPRTLPLGGKWSPTPGQALAALLAEYGGAYQICGPTVFNLYGWSTQVPQVTYAYNDRISGSRTIGPLRFQLIKVASKRLGDVEKIDEPDGTSTNYSSRTRSLVDAINDWSRFNTLPLAYEWVRAELSEGRVGAGALVSSAIRYGDIATRRRLGEAIERAGASGSALKRLAESLSRTSSPIPWIPNRPKQGPTNPRWGVVVNDGD